MKWLRFTTILFMLAILVLNALPGSVDGSGFMDFIRIFGKVSNFLVIIRPGHNFVNAILFWPDHEIVDLDKMVHFTLYFTLALLYFRSYSIKSKNFFFLTGFSLLDELHQIPFPGRYFCLSDLLFNFYGIVFALIILNYEKH